MRPRPGAGGSVLRLFLVMPGVGGQLVAQASDRFVVGVQRLQFVEQALLQVGQFGGLDPVLARQG